MERFKDFGTLNENSAEHRAGWRYQIRFIAFQAPKSLTGQMIAEWCADHWGDEQPHIHLKTDLLWWFRDWRWLYMKHPWQVVEFKVRWWSEGQK